MNRTVWISIGHWNGYDQAGSTESVVWKAVAGFSFETIADATHETGAFEAFIKRSF